jgi:hypothetical protein
VTASQVTAQAEMITWSAKSVAAVEPNASCNKRALSKPERGKKTANARQGTTVPMTDRTANQSVTSS